MHVFTLYLFKTYSLREHIFLDGHCLTFLVCFSVFNLHFFFLLQSLFIQPYSNVGLQSFSCSYSVCYNSTGCRSLRAVCTPFSHADPVHTHVTAHTYNYTHAVTMRKTHFILRSKSHICLAFNVQSLTLSATKVMQSTYGLRCCYPLILL